jgi:hypothetical protein
MVTFPDTASPGSMPTKRVKGGTALSILAIRHLRSMRGASQSQLFECSDGSIYVVKFKNSPQHRRVLANELFATRLARTIDLPMALGSIVEVPQFLITQTALTICLQNQRIPCQAGLQFGSRYVVNPLSGRIWDYMPSEMTRQLRNMEAFAGMLAFDIWVGNSDRRQAVFWRLSHERSCQATFIDNDLCFNGGEWNFPDGFAALVCRPEYYRRVSGWSSFEPWLPAIEEMPEGKIAEIAGSVPGDWYENKPNEIDQLIDSLIKRRKQVRGLIEGIRLRGADIFPSWKEAA